MMFKRRTKYSLLEIDKDKNRDNFEKRIYHD